VGRASLLAPGRVFEVNAAPLPSGGALVVLHDVTSIEAAQKSRREFVANVSHELRTPLTSIQGYVETLIEDPNPSPETTLEFLGVILKNASRMNRLTEDLLALASVESPDYKLTCSRSAPACWCRTPSTLSAASFVDSGVNCNPPAPRRPGHGRSRRHAPGLRQPDGERAQIRQSGKRIRTAPASSPPRCNSQFRISAPASPPSTWNASSSASTASTRPARAIRRHRPRSGHRQAHRAGPRRPHLGRKRTRQRRQFPLHAAAGARPTIRASAPAPSPSRTGIVLVCSPLLALSTPSPRFSAPPIQSN
jgi:hypothetical protein